MAGRTRPLALGLRCQRGVDGDQAAETPMFTEVERRCDADIPRASRDDRMPGANLSDRQRRPSGGAIQHRHDDNRSPDRLFGDPHGRANRHARRLTILPEVLDLPESA